MACFDRFTCYVPGTRYIRISSTHYEWSVLTVLLVMYPVLDIFVFRQRITSGVFFDSFTYVPGIRYIRISSTHYGWSVLTVLIVRYPVRDISVFRQRITGGLF